MGSGPYSSLTVWNEASDATPDIWGYVETENKKVKTFVFGSQRYAKIDQSLFGTGNY